MWCRVAVVAVLVVLAGCSGTTGGAGGATSAVTTGTPTGTATGTDAPARPGTGAAVSTRATATATSEPTPAATPVPNGERVAVDGELAANATLVFERVEGLVGREVEPSRVVVRHAVFGGSLGYDDPIKRILHFTATRPYVDSTRGMTRRAGKVYIHPGEGSPDEVEHALAHEFVHVVQFRRGMVPWVDSTPENRDRFQAHAMLAEGGAVYVADRYVERYGLNSTTHRERARQRYEAGPTGTRYIYSLYYFGARYADRNLDSPRNLSTLYENPPTTSEQVLHDLSPAAEPPRNLTVTYETRAWRVPRTDRTGELFVRVALRDQLTRAEAAPAAAGWGNDELAVFRNDQAAALAWTLRWDDPANATAFADAFETYRERRATAFDFRLTRVDANTTVVFAGQPFFVANATARANESTVTVTAPPA